MHKFTPMITVPAHNEEDLLPRLFASLAAQDWHQQNQERLQVVIVLNNCTDNSRGTVEKAIAAYPNLAINLIDIQYEKKDAHVGNARRLAMETAYSSATNPAQTAILTTDADSTPLPDWVTNNLRHLADGVDLVCGIIWLNKAEYEQLDIKLTKWTKIDQDHKQAVDYLDSLINPTAHNPWPRHTDHTSQSFAIRADVYRAVGGLPPLPSGEDYALVERVSEAGYRIRHPLDVVVETSARLVGRAPGGQSGGPPELAARRGGRKADIG